MNLGITVEITLMPTGKTLEYITTKTQIREETEEIKAKTLIGTTHGSIKIEHTRQYPIITTTKNLTQKFLYPVQQQQYLQQQKNYNSKKPKPTLILSFQTHVYHVIYATIEAFSAILKPKVVILLCLLDKSSKQRKLAQS